MSISAIVLNGLQNASQRFDGYASRILKDTAGAAESQRGVEDRLDLSGDALDRIGGDDQSLVEAVVGLGTAKQAYGANAKLLRVQDEMDKALLDIIS